MLALMLCFTSGLLVTLILVVNAARGAHKKLAQFLNDMMGDEPMALAGLGDAGSSAAGSMLNAAWRGLAKAE